MLPELIKQCEDYAKQSRTICQVKYKISDAEDKELAPEITDVCFARLANNVKDASKATFLYYKPIQTGHKEESVKISEAWGEKLKSFVLFKHPSVISFGNYWKDGITLNIKEAGLSPDLLYSILCMVRMPDEDPEIVKFCLEAPEKLGVNIAQAFMFATRKWARNSGHGILPQNKNSEAYLAYGGTYATAAQVTLGTLYLLGRLFNGASTENDKRSFLEEAKKFLTAKAKHAYASSKTWEPHLHYTDSFGVLGETDYLLDPALKAVCFLENRAELTLLESSLRKERPELFAKRPKIVEPKKTNTNEVKKNVVQAG